MRLPSAQNSVADPWPNEIAAPFCVYSVSSHRPTIGGVSSLGGFKPGAAMTRARPTSCAFTLNPPEMRGEFSLLRSLEGQHHCLGFFCRLELGRSRFFRIH